MPASRSAAEARRKVAPGIYRLIRHRREVGFRAWVSVYDPERPKGRLVTKRFPVGTHLTTIKQWREDARSEARREGAARRRRTPSTGFAGDADTYLKAVAAMPTYSDRARDIARWVALFGDRPRHLVTSAEIAAALASWANAGAAPATVNHRRTALMHLWSVLDGKHAANPVRDVPRLREPDPQPRGLPYPLIRRILDAMPATKTRARLKVLAFTGIPPAQIKQIRPSDVDFGARTVTVRGRRKGSGTAGRAVRLTADAVVAFREFVARDAWGPFSHSSMYKSFRLACGKVEQADQRKPKAQRTSLAGVRPYDLRHSFGTALYAATGDIRATQTLMGHSRAEMTHRYTLGAVDAREVEAITRLERQMAAEQARPPRSVGSMGARADKRRAAR